jgi:uncharacterized caspase-like protein
MATGMLRNLCLWLFVLCVALPFGAVGQGRTALVIGNADYEADRLRNPVQDAEGMAEVLGNRGFEVILRRNVNQWQFEEAVHEFRRRLQR